jgi:hypothetical protein
LSCQDLLNLHSRMKPKALHKTKRIKQGADECVRTLRKFHEFIRKYSASNHWNQLTTSQVGTCKPFTLKFFTSSSFVFFGLFQPRLHSLSLRIFWSYSIQRATKAAAHVYISSAHRLWLMPYRQTITNSRVSALQFYQHLTMHKQRPIRFLQNCNWMQSVASVFRPTYNNNFKNLFLFYSVIVLFIPTIYTIHKYALSSKCRTSDSQTDGIYNKHVPDIKATHLLNSTIC